MLPKKLRISRGDFKIIKERALTTSSKSIFLSVYTNKENKAKFAVSVSKKVSKGAVLRNLLRRRAYSVIEKIVSKVKPAYYVFIFKNATKKDFSLIEKDILDMLSFLKMIN